MTNVRVEIKYPPNATREQQQFIFRKMFSRFNRTVTQEGILSEASRLTEYETPKERQARKAKNARKRNYKGR